MVVLLNNNINTYSGKNISPKNNFKNNSQISFSGKFTDEIAEKASKPIVPAIKWLLTKEPTQRFINWAVDNKSKLQVGFIAGTSCTLSSFYMIDTARSKTIDKERKGALLWNMGIVGAMTTVGAVALDTPIKNATAKLGKYISKVNKGLQTPERLSKIEGSLGLGTRLILFTLMYRYLSPVVATPLASKAVNFFQNKHKAQKTDTVA